MRISIWIIAAVLALLSLAAGAAKIAAAPQEIQFFQDAQVSIRWMLPMGVLQVVGGILTIFRRSRKFGAIIAAAGFLLSAAMIFVTGNLVFAVVSLLPAALAALLFWLSDRQA